MAASARSIRCGPSVRPNKNNASCPKLASGEALSAFALTEPNAGSDLTALRTRAVLDGDEYVVNGEKLFITNVRPGRTIGLVCLIEDKPAVLIVDLPPEENEHFQLKKYGLYALQIRAQLRHPLSRFSGARGEPVGTGPRRWIDDRLSRFEPGPGRAVCERRGTMRMMLASILPWAWHRRTYGEPIAKRELVRRRMGRMAGLIVASDAMTEWCGSLLDAGFRGEMECIIAKIFGSEAQKEATIELLMKTHGGRAFLHGHLFGDNVHDFLAPCIYEGEGEMLGMAFFKSLVKHHGKLFFEPIGRTLHAAGIKKAEPRQPRPCLEAQRPSGELRGLVPQRARHAQIAHRAWTTCPKPSGSTPSLRSINCSTGGLRFPRRCGSIN